MFCPNDGIENREGAKRCKKCGSCLNCGERDPGEKVCKKCRIPLSDAGPRQCPKGHSLPAGTDRCDICDGASTRPIVQAPILPGSGRRGDTEMDDLVARPPIVRPEEPRARRATQFGTARKIVGILVTYSWKKEGEVFEIREGRNLIGSDNDCDVHVAYDPGLSGKHAHITFLKSFVIGDMVSMSGTFVDNQPVEAERIPLRNGASIRTGGTVWTFIAIPAEGEASNR